MGGSRGSRKAAQNAKTKAANAAKTKKHYDDLGSGEKVSYGDIAYSAAGAIPFVGGALAAKDLASGIAGVGTSGIAGDVIDGVGAAGKSLGKAAQVGGALTGIVGAGAAAYDAAQLYNKKSYQDKTPEEQEAFRNRRSTRGNKDKQRAAEKAREAEMLAAKQIADGLEGTEDVGPGGSPLTKNSPLYATFKDRSGGATGYGGGYQYLSDRIGDSVNDAVAENRATQDRIRQEEDRQREQQRQDLNTQIQQNTYQQQKIKQAEGLVVAGDTGFNNVNSAVEGASRGLADSAGALTARLNKNEIGIDEFSQQYAQIKAQVPGIKKWKETLTANLEGYKQGLDSGQLSKANSTQTNELYASLLADDGRYQLAPDENGVVMFTGVTDSGDPVSIPVNGIDQMPTPSLAVKSPYELLKPTLKELQGSLNEWNDDATGVVKGQFDIFLGEQGEKGLKSLAVDHFGLSLEEANALNDTPAEGYSNALEQYAESKWIGQAETKFIADDLTAKQDADFAFKQAELNRKQKLDGKPNAGQLKALRDQNNQQKFNVLAGTPGGLTQYKGSGKGTIQDITYDDGVGSVWDSEPQYTITLKDGTEKEYTADEAADYLGNHLGITSGGTQQGAPAKTPAQLAAEFKNRNNPVKKTGPSPLNMKSPFLLDPTVAPQFGADGRPIVDWQDEGGAGVLQGGYRRSGKDKGLRKKELRANTKNERGRNRDYRNKWNERAAGEEGGWEIDNLNKLSSQSEREIAAREAAETRAKLEALDADILGATDELKQRGQDASDKVNNLNQKHRSINKLKNDNQQYLQKGHEVNLVDQYGLKTGSANAVREDSGGNVARSTMFNSGKSFEEIQALSNQARKNHETYDQVSGTDVTLRNVKDQYGTWGKDRKGKIKKN